MRKHLRQDFNRIYTFNLHGDIRQDSMRDGIALGEKHTVFGLSAMVGVTITLLVKSQALADFKIFYSEVSFRSTRLEKFLALEKYSNIYDINWREIRPDKKNTWLNDDLRDEFSTLLPIGNKEIKSSKLSDDNVLFKLFSNGVKTNRDAWAYNFDKANLSQNIERTIKIYNQQVFEWTHRFDKKINFDDLIIADCTKISWSEGLKKCLGRGITISHDANHIRNSLYRPFTCCFLYFDARLNERRYQFLYVFPTSATELENRVLCVTGIGAQQPFATFISKTIPDLNFFGSGTVPQWFPFYSYDKDGANRRENITDWTLNQFCSQYQDNAIAKWDIFHYVYGVLHHPHYRTRYAANLKRELPHIPFAPDFWAFANAGKRLAEIHITYEQQPEHPLKWIENPDLPLDWRVKKMKLNKDKTQLVYNDFLTLSGIPSKTFDYRLGNRSALDWIIDQYQIKTDKRSGITNNPNRLDDEQYIVRLIGQVITVSLETVEIVNSLPSLGIPNS
jgi:predicted helicase